MNRPAITISTLLGLLVLASPGRAQNYSIREVGFVDVETKPYRLIVMSKDLDESSVAKQKKWLASEFANTNIVLVTQIATPSTLTPQKKPFGASAGPQFWLVAPDDRVLPFNASVMTGDLVQSPLRQEILRQVTSSLGAVVLLESTDPAANEKAKAKAEGVLEQINKVRRHLEHAPDGDVSLLVLPVADRPRERWTLWGLGEDAVATDTPKIAVLFGKMRRAGALFEGTEWQDDDLFARIAALGQACEDELDRRQHFSTPLPFKWASDWHGQLALNLPFDPLDDDIKEKLAAVLQRPKLADQDRTPRRLTPGAFVLAQEEPIQAEPKREETPRPGASLASGVVVLLAGFLGWIALGLSVWYLENRRGPEKS